MINDENSIINENLRYFILSRLPEDYTKLEKAIFIYDRLCHYMEYSFDYFLEEDKFKDYYKNVYNLKHVDGKKNNKVVCFTFNRIFVELLHDAELISDNDYLLSIDHGKVMSEWHTRVVVNIDNVEYHIDATEGLLDNNDLVLAKYSNHKYIGWKIDCPDKNLKEKIVKNLDDAMEKVCINSNLSKLEQNYIILKSKDDSYQNMSLEERKNLFLNLAISNKVPAYSVQAFNYLLKLKNLLFSEQELNGKNIKISNRKFTCNKKAGILFVKDRENKEYKAIFAFNPEGYTNDKGFENFDTLQLFDISILNKTVNQVSLEELKAKFEDKKYSHRNNQKFTNHQLEDILITSGLMRLDAVFTDDIYKDTSSGGYLRTMANGKQVYLSQKDYEELSKN